MKLKDYEWVLFDADDTLFHFDAFAGLKMMFKDFDVDFTQEDYESYQRVNKPLWVEYQNGTISAKELQYRRFDAWAQELQVSAHELNSAFLLSMAEVCVPLEGAVSLLNSLKGKVKLGIVTNGFTELQEIRLKRTGLEPFFDLLVISEQIGIAKPHAGIFEHAFSQMGHPKKEKVLMVGDNPDSDILGGINAGIHTCWINAQNKALPEGIVPHYQVSSLVELESLLMGK